MAVNVMVGSFTFSPDAGLPEQISREASTTVRVFEGETLAVGGLRQQEMSEIEVRVPLLGDIPLLGRLFRKTEKETRSTVLTIFITPHIMREGSEAPPWPQVDLENGHRISAGRVESNGRLLPIPSLPLIKPDLQFSRIRLSCKFRHRRYKPNCCRCW